MREIITKILTSPGENQKKTNNQNSYFTHIGKIQLYLTFNRIVIITVYALALMAGGFLITAFNAIGKTVIEIFDTYVLTVNLCNLMFYFLFVPANFIVVKCVDKFGMRYSVNYLFKIIF